MQSNPFFALCISAHVYMYDCGTYRSQFASAYHQFKCLRLYYKFVIVRNLPKHLWYRPPKSWTPMIENMSQNTRHTSSTLKMEGIAWIKAFTTTCRTETQHMNTYGYGELNAVVNGWWMGSVFYTCTVWAEHLLEEKTYYWLKTGQEHMAIDRLDRQFFIQTLIGKHKIKRVHLGGNLTAWSNGN